jgi:hypothetical protein
VRLDLGDVVLDLNLRVKGMRAPRLIWKVGPFSDSKPADRIAGPRPAHNAPPKGVDVMADLKADQTAQFELAATDEMGNPVPLPAGSTVTYSVDRPDLVSLVDNGDGTGSVTAVGPLGDAVLSAAGTVNGREATGTLLVSVVAGDAERFTIEMGEPTEATPDA